MKRKQYLITISLLVLSILLTGCLGGLSIEDKEQIGQKVNLWLEGLKNREASKIYSTIIPKAPIKTTIQYKNRSSLSNSFNSRDDYINRVTSGPTWLYTRIEKFEVKNIIISSGDNTVTVTGDLNTKAVFTNRNVILNLLEQSGEDISFLRKNKTLDIFTTEDGKIVFKLLKIDGEWYINEFGLLDYVVQYGYEE